MKFEKAYVPANSAWFSPFARWQAAFAEVSSLDLAVDVATRALSERAIDPGSFGVLVFGQSVPQRYSFYAAPTVAARIGAPGISGPAIAQACATSAACVAFAGAAVELGEPNPVFVLTTDRTSNGPLLIFPQPSAAGGAPSTEHWILDNFALDPWGGHSMLQTAEFVAAEESISREEMDELTALRYAQYRDALANDRAIQRRAMVPVEIRRGKKDRTTIDADVGVHDTSPEALAKLRPVIEGGRITFGMQTHPADGAAGLVVTTKARAREIAGGRGLLRLLATAFARVEKARMPKAPVAAARAVLAEAGLTIADVDVVTTHNPFAVNDVYFSREMGFDPARMNPYGSSLVWGHPQGPTGLRSLAELTLALEARGGGVGLFTGCAAGDSSGAVLVRLDG